MCEKATPCTISWQYWASTFFENTRGMPLPSLPMLSRHLRVARCFGQSPIIFCGNNVPGVPIIVPPFRDYFNAILRLK